MGFLGAQAFSHEDLKLFTDNFSKQNFIGYFQYGRVYRGRRREPKSGEVKEVTVKIWEKPKLYNVDHPENNRSRMLEEITLLLNQSMVSHPRLMRLTGYCLEGVNVGIVYDFKPFDTVHNLVVKESFSWLQRIKVLLQFASLLEFFHTPQEDQLPYLVCNVDAAHLLLDEECNMKLFDFSLITGGIFPNRINKVTTARACHGYTDPATCGPGGWEEGCDVFAFGIVLLLLITKRVFVVEEFVDTDDMEVYLEEWAMAEYERHKSRMGYRNSKFSLVHKSLEMDSYFYCDDGPNITKLALHCVAAYPDERATMKEALKSLLRLDVVRRHADILQVEQILRDNPLKAKRSGMLRWFPFV